ncbi:helix-turn-helix domain-containing protein [Companilactobacillus kimchii]|uniref:helix-turn-helix domain-containing protein n=1 Tax=Companilactobacillus kimchii TaxID=2801452 RepID=UPI0006D2B24C|nr:helix-turn-helix transcriptional regulator [Companilactobacillus kimchii]
MFLGSVIYDKRRSLNLTQSDLASGLCNQNTISKMEKHNMTPQMDVLIKICQRLDLSLNDVFSEFSSDSKPEQLLFWMISKKMFF